MRRLAALRVELRRISRRAALLAAARCYNALPPLAATLRAAALGVTLRTVSCTVLRDLMRLPPPDPENLPLESRRCAMMILDVDRV